jgi:hypothetical protein
MTSETSQPTLWQETESELTLSAEAFRAKMSPSRAAEAGWRLSAQVCGVNTGDSFASYDPQSSLWKTHQACLVSGWELFSETWPRSVIVSGLTAYQQRALAPITSEIVSGSLPTILKGNSSLSGGQSNHRKKWLKKLPTLCARDYRGGVHTGENCWDVGRFVERLGLAINAQARFPRQYELHKPVMGRGVYGVPNRVDRIAALGNAVVPQIPELLGRAYLESVAS